MAYNELLTRRVRETLAHRNDVAEQKMFKGIVFMVDGKMCISAADDRLMLRIDPDLHESLLQKPGVSTVVMHNKPYIGYLYVKEAVLANKKDFDYWIDLALAFNPKAKASKKKKKA